VYCYYYYDAHEQSWWSEITQPNLLPNTSAMKMHAFVNLYLASPISLANVPSHPCGFANYRICIALHILRVLTFSGRIIITWIARSQVCGKIDIHTRSWNNLLSTLVIQIEDFRLSTFP
jgi:hypothetical protein